MLRDESPPQAASGFPDLDPNSPLDELELAYQRALAEVDAIESALPDEVAALGEEHGHSGRELALERSGRGAGSSPALPPAPSLPDESTTNRLDGPRRITPRQVIEAALFVGGEPLTARKLCSLLPGDSDHEFVDRAVDDLNRQYAAQGRPVVLRLVEGGYRMELRSEFEGVRSRVFGYGPKDVRLSQDAVETLAVVAYRQPVTRGQVEHTLGRPAGGVLNQLLRRELIALERGETSGDAVTYRTTARFLELFGLGGVHELPQADDLSFK
ncbi:MAG TPA: SMC-Scp complex subunit ScpB [Planctomycetaceae bacterium]|nr:SMC-Scp complex subunit ScpB [Planctomycetaceae bacterium]